MRRPQFLQFDAAGGALRVGGGWSVSRRVSAAARRSGVQACWIISGTISRPASRLSNEA